MNYLGEDADPFQLPYEDVAPNISTFEQMRDVVCTRKIRPTLSPRWQNHPVRFEWTERETTTIRDREKKE